MENRSKNDGEVIVQPSPLWQVINLEGLAEPQQQETRERDTSQLLNVVRLGSQPATELL